jgi:hypothetical protein
MPTIHDEADDARGNAARCRVCERRWDQHNGTEQHRFEYSSLPPDYTPEERELIERASWSLPVADPEEL